MAQRKLRLSMDAAELLLAVAPDLDFLASTFPGLDLALEAHKCTAYWNQEGGAKNWKLAFFNWVQKASVPRAAPVQHNGHNDGRGFTRGQPDMNRQAFLEDYIARREQA